MQALRGQETAGGRGMGGTIGRNARMPKRGKNCQPDHRHSPNGKRDREWGRDAGPINTRSCEKRSPISPPIHLPIHPSLCPHITLCPLHILGSQNIAILSGKQEKKSIGGERGTQGEIEVKEMAGGSGSVSGCSRS